MHIHECTCKNVQTRIYPACDGDEHFRPEELISDNEILLGAFILVSAAIVIIVACEVQLHQLASGCIVGRPFNLVI